MEQLNVHLVIHYDPVVTDDARWIQMRREVSDLVNGINPRLSIHDFRIVTGAKQEKLVFDLGIPYDLSFKNSDLQQQINDRLAQDGYHYQTVIHFDRVP